MILGMQMYGATKPKPGVKPGMKPKMMADGDLGAPSDMDAPMPPADEPETGDEASLEMVNKKLDAIMEALQIPMPDEAPPDDVMAPGGPNTPAGNPETQP